MIRDKESQVSEKYDVTFLSVSPSRKTWAIVDFCFMMQVISFSGVYRLNFMECFMQMYYFYLIFCIFRGFYGTKLFLCSSYYPLFTFFEHLISNINCKLNALEQRLHFGLFF